jgi:hypothetical protein
LPMNLKQDGMVHQSYLRSDLGHLDGLGRVGYFAIVCVGGRVLLVEEGGGD